MLKLGSKLVQFPLADLVGRPLVPSPSGVSRLLPSRFQLESTAVVCRFTARAALYVVSHQFYTTKIKLNGS